MICQLLSTNKSITDMKLSRNLFDDNSIVLIANVLMLNNSLKEIELNDVGMGSRGFISLCTLERITVGSNRFTSKSL